MALERFLYGLSSFDCLGRFGFSAAWSRKTWRSDFRMLVHLAVSLDSLARAYSLMEETIVSLLFTCLLGCSLLASSPDSSDIMTSSIRLVSRILSDSCANVR